jgi:hypothetical protein
MTVWPRSAKQAAHTAPTYPNPKTLMFMTRYHFMDETWWRQVGVLLPMAQSRLSLAV